MKRGQELYWRKWVRDWWADQMRSRECPDVPKEVDDPAFYAFWQQESARLANKLEGKQP